MTGRHSLWQEPDWNCVRALLQMEGGQLSVFVDIHSGYFLPAFFWRHT